MLQDTSDAMIVRSFPSWPTKVIAVLFTELDAMDCPAHAYLLPLSNYLAERSPWQPTSHAMNHASPHHRRRMRLYLMGKHICAPSRMRISSKSKLSFSKCIALTMFVFGTEVNFIFSKNALNRTGGNTPPYHRASGIYWRQRIPYSEAQQKNSPANIPQEQYRTQ